MTNTTFREQAHPVTTPPPFAVSVRNIGSADFVVEVRGELDLFTGPILQQQCESYFSGGSIGHPRKVVYLLPELSFMDARGLQYLLNAVPGRVGEQITVREPSSSVSRFLEVVGLASMVEQQAKQ